MFTIEQIKSAHAKVRSGADFPAYIQDLVQLGVTAYETFVADGHTVYFGKNNFSETSPAKYATLTIEAECNATQFKKELKEHQKGKSDYPTFCNQCAAAGVEKWVVDIHKMTCTYFDKTGNEVLLENIPAAKAL
ncbi:DUF1398 domain-containing protein [Ferruginibacter sp.]